MKKIIGLGSVSVMILLTACDNKKAEDKVEAAQQKVVVEKTVLASKYNNTIDPRCGMDVTDDMTDTLHYEKYVLGFCSSDCKDYFKKNPKAHIAEAKLKK
jgi:YHS domain-containing protein